MYFGNIADSELKQYHETVKNNFSMSLSNILSSDLFKIETIITDTIYKIYPLFYCDTITSTNKNDKILDNKCIICEKDTSTRLYFNTETEVPLIKLTQPKSTLVKSVSVLKYNLVDVSFSQMMHLLSSILSFLFVDVIVSQ